jgi:hypothetical protein
VSTRDLRLSRLPKLNQSWSNLHHKSTEAPSSIGNQTRLNQESQATKCKTKNLCPRSSSRLSRKQRHSCWQRAAPLRSLPRLRLRVTTNESRADREYSADRLKEAFHEAVRAVLKAGSVSQVKKIADRGSLASQGSMGRGRLWMIHTWRGQRWATNLTRCRVSMSFRMWARRKGIMLLGSKMTKILLD